eukprot:826918_1
MARSIISTPKYPVNEEGIIFVYRGNKYTIKKATDDKKQNDPTAVITINSYDHHHPSALFVRLAICISCALFFIGSQALPSCFDTPKQPRREFECKLHSHPVTLTGQYRPGVYKAFFDNDRQSNWMVKIIPITSRESIYTRMMALYSEQHPHIPTVGYWFTARDRRAKKQAIVLQLYPNGALSAYAEGLGYRSRKDELVRDEFILNCLSSLFYALRAFNQKGYIHSDVNMQNILIDRDGRCVLAEYGKAMAKSGLRQEDVIDIVDLINTMVCAWNLMSASTDQIPLCYSSPRSNQIEWHKEYTRKMKDLAGVRSHNTDLPMMPIATKDLLIKLSYYFGNVQNPEHSWAHLDKFVVETRNIRGHIRDLMFPFGSLCE